MARILLVDDEKIAHAVYGEALAAAGHEVVGVSSASEARAALAHSRFEVVVTDLILLDGNGMDLLQHTKESHPGVEVVVLTALDKVEPAVRAIKSGAADYVIKPVTGDVLRHVVQRALTAQTLLRENDELRRHVALVEAGQRVATTLDRAKLLSTAALAFAQLTGAASVLLFLENGARKLAAFEGVGEDEAKALEAQLSPLLGERDARPVQLSGSLPRGLILPALDGERRHGDVVLLFRIAVPEGAPSVGDYLARHLGLALSNLGRFAAVEDLAYLDDLTGLFNTRYLDIALEREMRASASGSGPFSLLFLDLDHFKAVNDTHGHLVGSKTLIEVGRVVKGCVRDDDQVFRFGGDEYVVLLHHTDSGGALKVAERIRQKVEGHPFLAREGYRIALTTCVGVASYPEHGLDKHQLLDLADRAMYRGKKTTRNIVYIASRGLEATPAERHRAAEG